MDAAFLPSRKLVDLFFPPDQASLVENAISANQDWCSQTGVIWKVRSPFYSSFFLGRAFQIRSSTPHQIGQSALALTDFLSDGQASATRASSRWKLERGIGSSGEAQLLDLKTIQADVQRHKFTDAEKVQHVDSSCWMPVWVASLWEKADLPDEIVLGLNNSPNSEDRPLIESVSITSGMLEGNVMKSRASNLLEEITRLEASKQTSGSTLSAGDEPASPIVIAAVGGPRNRSQTSTEEGVVKTKERPFESSVQLSKPMPGQSFPGGTDLDDVTVHLSRIRTSADTVDMSGRHADSSPLSARDLPPGSPSSSRLGRTESTRAREMELKLALGGLHEDPVKALKEQPRRAAEIVMQTLRTPMQLHLQAFLGDLWREAVTDRRTALGLVKTIKQEFRHFRSALWRRRTDAEEVCLIIDTSISFLKRTILPGGPAIQEINGGIRALVSLLESFPAPEGLGTQYVKAEEDLRSGREQMEKIFAKVVDCESKMLQVGSLPISGYAFLQRSARASNVHTPRTPATQRTDSPEGPLEDLNGASAFKVSPEEKLAARPNSGSDARVDTIAETDDDRKQNAQQVVVQVSALSEQPVRKQPDESFLFMKPRLGIHMTEAGTLLLPGDS